MGIAIQTGYIVWVHGPFPCGDWPDLRIMRDSIIYMIDDGEFLLADGGYNDGSNYAITPTGLNGITDRMKSTVRACHETMNSRLKKWGCLKQAFRHNLEKHGLCFSAVANVTQLAFEYGEPLFAVEYLEYR